MVRTNFGWGARDSRARAVVEQPDGKLVTAGVGWDDTDAFSLVRYLPDGTRDTTFGEGGRVVTVFSLTWLAFMRQLGAFGLVRASPTASSSRRAARSTATATW